MPIHENQNDPKMQVREWFERFHQSATVAQFLLALEYIHNYGYSIDVACPLAMESYKGLNLQCCKEK